MIRLASGLALAAAVLLAGCGSDASPAPSATPTPPASSAAASSTPAKESGSAIVSRGPQRCEPQDGVFVKIVLGALDCATANAVAARVDRDGDKRQDVDGYVCEFGNASIRPTIFTCTDRANGFEFAVDEVG